MSVCIALVNIIMLLNSVFHIGVIIGLRVVSITILTQGNAKGQYHCRRAIETAQGPISRLA